MQRETFSWSNFILIVIIHALALSGFFFFTWQSLIPFLISFYVFSLLGASVTLHHYLSHRSFTFNHQISKTISLFLATCCLQGGVIYWPAHHRFHHRYTDDEKDPHSRKRGFLWSHILWLFYKNPNGCQILSSYKSCPDLMLDKEIKWFGDHYYSVNIGFLILLLVICGLNERLDLFFAVGPLRIVAVWHATWLINSYSHNINSIRDKPLLINMLIPAEGNHLLHHQVPNMIQHNWVLKCLKKLSFLTPVKQAQS